MKLSFVIVILGFIIDLSRAGKSDDEIRYLPGIGFVPFKQYSGYLTGISDNYQLHYWFVEAQETPESKPLVLWLNGGPGCSSMEGFLSENGPFTVVARNKLEHNTQSWNKLANVIYLEAPAGVGYSYTKDGNVTTDDDLTAQNNFAALVNFLKRFPEYKGRDFYITGESYAGVYVPTLAVQILDHSDELDVNFKGIAVGNGLTSYLLNDNSLVYFASYHGLIGKVIWEDLLINCCDDPTKLKCMFTENETPKCQKLVAEVNNIINSGLDIYNLYDECAGGVVTIWDKWVTLNKGALGLSLDSPMVHTDLGNLFRSNRYVRTNRFRSLLHRTILKEPKVKLAIPCVNDTIITSYLRDPKVIKAIHVKTAGLPEWDVCSDAVNSQYVRVYQELSTQYKKVVESGLRVFIYNGDVDMACNYLGDEWFVDSLRYPMIEKRRSWVYDALDGTKQIGGFQKRYQPTEGGVLTFLTVRGSGHMVPTDRPHSAYHMFESFIKETPL